MNIVTEILSHLCIWPRPRLSKDLLDHVDSTLREARDEANRLAGELETIADRADDPFAALVHRARRSQFRRQIEHDQDQGEEE